MEIPFKNFIKPGEKYIIVEGGKPEYVFMHYDDYQELIERQGSGIKAAKAPEPAPHDFSHDSVLSAAHLPDDISKIRLEDLPL